MIITIYILSAITLLLAATVVFILRSSGSQRNEIRELNDKLISSTAEHTRLKENIAATTAECERLRHDAEQRAKDMNGQIVELTAENSRLSERLSILSNEKERMQRESEAQFKDLASRILEDKTQKSDNRLNEILKPLREEIERLNRDINERAEKDTRNHASLQEQIKMLAELNQRVSSDANNLAKALKGNSKVQGDWGEMILEQILSASGLTKGEQFDIQMTKDENGNTIANEEGGRLRPDVVVHFPDNKDLIIDSKVSITNYVDYVNADDKDKQDKSLAAHIASVRKHVDELAKKGYQDHIKNAGDFVMMFIPNEGAYLTAMQNDQKLWEDAYKKRIVIISPTHLISVLKLVSQLWSHDKQTKNAIEIATSAGRLYDKFVGFVSDMENINKAINNASDAYGKAMNKLSEGRGNILNSIESLKKLGAKATKQLPNAEE